MCLYWLWIPTFFCGFIPMHLVSKVGNQLNRPGCYSKETVFLSSTSDSCKLIAGQLVWVFGEGMAGCGIKFIVPNKCNVSMLTEIVRIKSNVMVHLNISSNVEILQVNSLRFRGIYNIRDSGFDLIRKIRKSEIRSIEWKIANTFF